MTQLSNSKATPRPFKRIESPVFKQNAFFSEIQLIGADEQFVCMVQAKNELAEANAALIIRAVNSFDAMKEALKGVVKVLDRMIYKYRKYDRDTIEAEWIGHTISDAKDVIALAEKEDL